MLRIPLSCGSFSLGPLALLDLSFGLDPAAEALRLCLRPATLQAVFDAGRVFSVEANVPDYTLLVGPLDDLAAALGVCGNRCQDNQHQT